jgi:hypothetical protein
LKPQSKTPITLPERIFVSVSRPTPLQDSFNGLNASFDNEIKKKTVQQTLRAISTLVIQMDISLAIGVTIGDLNND